VKGLGFHGNTVDAWLMGDVDEEKSPLWNKVTNSPVCYAKRPSVPLTPPSDDPFIKKRQRDF
jgi:hypothetical protein